MLSEQNKTFLEKLFLDSNFTMEKALFYYKHSNRNPTEWNSTVDKNTFRQITIIDYPFIKAYQVEQALLYSQNGRHYRVYHCSHI